MTPRLLETVLRDAAARAASDGADSTSDADLVSRFVETKDDAAFAALVARHGRIVWAVCRQSLPREADAEDAFQATFVALLRGAKSIRSGVSLPGWLHGTAVRVCLQARRQAGRLKKRESTQSKREAEQPVTETSWDGLLASVHEEVAKLPSTLRDVFVLIDLKGVSQSDAAEQLGWKAGTLTGRLSQARQKLLDRLTAKGLTPAIVLAGCGLGPVAANAIVPSSLFIATCAVSTNPSTIPATVSLLATAALEGTIMTKMKLLAAGVMLATATAMTVVAGQQSGSPPSGGGGAAVAGQGPGSGGSGSGTAAGPRGGGSSVDASPSGGGQGGQGGSGGSGARGVGGGGGRGMPGGMGGGGGMGSGAPGIAGGPFGMGGEGGAAGTPGGPGQPGMGGGFSPTRLPIGYEYKIVTVDNIAGFEGELNKLGSENWDLVTVASNSNSLAKSFIFKRTKLNARGGMAGGMMSGFGGGFGEGGGGGFGGMPGGGGFGGMGGPGGGDAGGAAGGGREVPALGGARGGRSGGGINPLGIISGAADAFSPNPKPAPRRVGDQIVNTIETPGVETKRLVNAISQIFAISESGITIVEAPVGRGITVSYYRSDEALYKKIMEFVTVTVDRAAKIGQ